VVLCGCEVWSLIIREEHSLRVFKNRVLRRVFGSKRDEVTGGWRKLHNEELCLYSSPSIIIIIKSRMMGGRVAWMKNECRLLVRRPEWKRALGRPKRSWLDNIKMDLVETGRCGVWTGLVWFRIGTSGELLWTRWWTFSFNNMLINYRVATELVASKPVPSSVDFVC
jgi:hypothetical protein